MADTSSLRAYINANMTAYGTQGITGSELVNCLLSLCDLLDASFTTFNKVGTTSAGANAEDVYHTGKVGIGNTSPSEQLHVTGNAYIDGILKSPNSLTNRKISLYELTANDHQFYGFGINLGSMRYQIGQVADAHVFYAGTSPTTSSELARITGSGYVGIGNSGPTSAMHVKGATGHQQLRLETSYTPTGTSDSNGQTGQIAWDASFFYVKTGSGWKRSALSTF